MQKDIAKAADSRQGQNNSWSTDFAFDADCCCCKNCGGSIRSFLKSGHQRIHEPWHMSLEQIFNTDSFLKQAGNNCT